jgi:hypothetical protein
MPWSLADAINQPLGQGTTPARVRYGRCDPRRDPGLELDMDMDITVPIRRKQPRTGGPAAGQLLALRTSQLLTLSVVPQAPNDPDAQVGPSTKSTVAHSV